MHATSLYGFCFVCSMTVVHAPLPCLVTGLRLKWPIQLSNFSKNPLCFSYKSASISRFELFAWCHERFSDLRRYRPPENFPSLQSITVLHSQCFWLGLPLSQILSLRFIFQISPACSRALLKEQTVYLFSTVNVISITLAAAYRILQLRLILVTDPSMWTFYLWVLGILTAWLKITRTLLQ